MASHSKYEFERYPVEVAHLRILAIFYQSKTALVAKSLAKHFVFRDLWVVVVLSILICLYLCGSN